MEPNLLPCPFCGSSAEVTDESQPKRPKSWFFAWCKNRDGCNSWLADKSPEDVAKKWNTRSVTAMEEQLEQDLKLAGEVIADLESARNEWKQRAAKAHAEMMAMKERLMKLADSFAEDAKSHRKHSDAASAETTKICHLSAWDAYKNADRRVMDAVHGETAF